ncbi:MAG: hypothetical protein KME26_02285 [Oscillatoria princeps RMCB-10]|jgi:Ca2+-binding RTX toxin-like protein|nr:hypothetical protein [Oscillatoria princeps RMCB-10]
MDFRYHGASGNNFEKTLTISVIDAIEAPTDISLDTLTGGAGDDVLCGGKGSDTLTGGAGSDIFLLTSGKGSDIIIYFSDGTDSLALAGDLTFEELVIAQSAGAVTISLAATGELLASLSGVGAGLINSEDFTAV